MLPPTSLSIGELVSRSGFDRRTIVYYIQQGLLPKVGRRGPNTRYPAECLSRLKFISKVKKLQDHGQLPTITLADIARVLGSLSTERLNELGGHGEPGAAPGESEAAAIVALFTAPAENGGSQPVADAGALTGPPPRMETTQVRAPASDVPPPARPADGALPAHRRSYGLADASIRQRFPQAPPRAGDPAEPVLPPAPSAAPASEPPSVAGEPGISAGHDEQLGALLRELELRPTLNQRRQPPGAPEQWTEVPITSRIYLSVRGLSAEDAPLAEGVGRILKRALRGR